ncbi:MAG: helicase-related protein, partial [Pseudomonadota bacterium]|nr:helicase-related protein [Pseudomonadota bacterium]
VRWLLKRCPPTNKRQSLLFSATLSEKVMELAYEHLNISEATNINPGQITVDKIEQNLYHVGKHEKMALLFGLLHREKPERSLIFTNTKRMAEILEDYLKANGYAAACLTGDVPQKKRLATLERFKNKKLNILIATDVASRGLHIEAVTHVFNYDLPQDAEDYVHRIGRTARIGATGNAIALAGEEDAFYLEAIEKLAGKIPVIWAEDEDFTRNFKRPQRRSQGSSRTPGRGKPGDSRGRGGSSSSSRRKPSRPTDSKYEPKKRRPGSDGRSDQESKQPSRKRGSSTGNNQGEAQKSSENRSRRRPPRKQSGGEQAGKSMGTKSTERKQQAAKTVPKINKNVDRKVDRPTPKTPVKVQTPKPQTKKKKGILGKIVGLFKGNDQ